MEVVDMVISIGSGTENGPYWNLGAKRLGAIERQG